MRRSVICAVFVVAAIGAASILDAAEVGAAHRRAPHKRFAVDGVVAWSVDSGGDESSGGSFALTATIGQPDAGTSSQGGTVLDGGLWAGVANHGFIFGNGFEDGSTGSWSSVVGQGTKERP